MRGDGWMGSFEARAFPEPNSGCWLWIGDLTDGVPICRSVSARRGIYMRKRGPVPNGHAVRSHCGSDLCVNPDHLTAYPWGVVNARPIAACAHEGCDRQAVKREYCDAHYDRVRAGRSMGAPIRVVDPMRGCRVNGCAGSHYGDGFCRRHHKQLRQSQRKRELVEALGGSCADCGGRFHPAAMDFHHLDRALKEINVAELLAWGSMDAARAEAAKCILLCANCHRIRHASTDIDFVFNQQEATNG